jgi:DNA-binding PadR family transcriptional regulator
VINDEELSAVEIKTRADFSIGQFYWAPAVSHIRRELARLLEYDMVREREVSTGPVRTTVRYQSTDRGERLLEAWAAALPEDESVVVKHPLLLRIWFARGADSRRLLPALDRHIERTQEQIAELRWALRRGEELGLADEPRIPHARAISEYKIRNLYAEIANCQQLRDDLARGTNLDLAATVTRSKGELRRRSPAGSEQG